MFVGDDVIGPTAPQDSDCPASCVYTPIASSGVDTNYQIETSCAEYVNNVPRANTYTPGYCQIGTTDQSGTFIHASADVCANGQYTLYDAAASICIRTIATTEATCEQFPHPEVSECAAVPMVGTATAANDACIAVPGCVYVPNEDDNALPGDCTPVGGSIWVPNQCRDSTDTEVCQEVVMADPAAQNAAANRLVCESQSGCVYTPDDAATPE